MKQINKMLPGMSCFEFTISLSLFAISVFMLLLALGSVIEKAEELVLNNEVTNLRWQLRETWAHNNATGKKLNLSNIENTNPMNLIAELPGNYLGEYPETPSSAKYNWYFNTNNKRLVYVLANGKEYYFQITRGYKLRKASIGAVGGMDLVPDLNDEIKHK